MKTLAKWTVIDLKKHMYASVGIQEYWIVDVQKKRLIVFRNPMKADYSSRQDIVQGAIAPLAFPEVGV